MKIVLSGGGTLGPVTPLLAIRNAIKKKYPQVEFIWIGTKNGPEQTIITKAGIPFIVIVGGKWRRYFSFWNLLDIFKIFIAFWQCFFFLIKEQPSILISAGGFISVPLHWAGALLGIPTWVHQQDVRVGLANKLMFPFAVKITTALQETIKNVPKRKTEWIGNPCRDLSIAFPLQVAREKFNIPTSAPIIFALGGGTGSATINKIVLEALPHWPRGWHIIHLTGKERPHELAEQATSAFPNYHVYQFFTEEIKYAYAIADIVIARGGFGTLTELAVLSKPALILPMFGTHQEDNAQFFAKQGGIFMLEQWMENGLKLAQIVKGLMESPQKKQALGERLHTLLPRAQEEKIIAVVEEIIPS